MTEIPMAQLVAFGAKLRAQRQSRGLSLRALAAEAGVSSSYLASIETAHNPTTGRPATPSVRVLGALSRALDLDLVEMVNAVGPADGQRAGAHSLLYVLGDRPSNALSHVIRLHPEIARWIYVPDMRESDRDTPPEVRRRTALRCDWPLDGAPYSDHYYDADRITTQLTDELSRSVGEVRPDETVGLAFADCSSVMRWVENPLALIGVEPLWPAEVDRVFDRALGHRAAANVCVFLHSDFQAMGLRIDPLSIAVSLLRAHSSVAVLGDDGELTTGSLGAQRLLDEVRPAGVSTDAWRELSRAAARSLVGDRPTELVDT